MKLTVALQMDIRSRLLGVKLGRKPSLLILMREREDVSDYGGRRVVVRDEVRLPTVGPATLYC